MKQLLLLLSITGLLVSCSKDSNSPYTYSSESTIYSSSETTTFKDILFILKPYIVVNNQKEYLVNSYIRNISVKVNNSVWGIYQSVTLDTSQITKTVANNYYVSTDMVKYSVIASQQSAQDTLQTAGEYSSLINNYLTLSAGDYICQIQYFDIQLTSGQTKRVYPLIAVLLEIQENIASAFIGEFEIEIKN